MSYSVEITDIALKQYRKINKPYSTLIKDKIDLLAEKGLQLNNIKQLTGEFKGLYRLRVGDYRIIFSLEDNLITVIAILHRKDAYQ